VVAVAHAWTRRGPPTALSPALLWLAGARDLPDLLEGLLCGQYALDASAALAVFEVAAAGDTVAAEVVRWAGCELGELANAVIRQLELQQEQFDVVLLGGMYQGGAPLIEPMRQTIHALAPGARLVRLTAPPVVGAVLLGMEQAGLDAAPRREALIDSVTRLAGE
jgi:N-acetylglucosamine kinase-like BadF-type ATPase